MFTFKNIKDNQDIKDTIESIFNINLAITGGWGYTIENATIIKEYKDKLPLNQLEHMIVSMRVHLEMNITQDKNSRYAGINANELNREIILKNSLTYDKVTYIVTAIKDDLYTEFMKDYKNGYGTDSFNITEHFKKRKEATLTREIIHYFEVTNLTNKKGH